MQNLFRILTLLGGFCLGYFIRDIGFDQTNKHLDKNNSVAESELENYHRVSSAQKDITPTRQSSNCQYIYTLAVPEEQVPEILEVMPEEASVNHVDEQLSGFLDYSLLQNKSYEEITSSEEYQELISLFSSEPEARERAMEHFLAVSETPMGQALSTALGLSKGDFESPQIQEAAIQLLQEGSAEQRLNALRILGPTGHNQNTRATVLDILKFDLQADAELTMAAISSLNRQGVVSQTAREEVVEAVVPYIYNQNPQVRQNSLQILLQWASHDESILHTFVEATHDPDPGVRSLAFSALGQGGLDYESVRAPALSALQDPNENPNVKAAALQALEGFPLDEQALKVYQASLSSSVYEQPSIEAGFN